MPASALMKEIKVTLAGERQEFICQLLDRSETHVVVLYPVRQARRVAKIVLPRGTASYGYFWRDRPYNVYHWVAPDGRTLGYYVNLADQVIIRRNQVEWRDLAVDLLFSGDGSRVRILDENELGTVPAELHARIESARAHVLRHRDDLLAEVSSATAHLRHKRQGNQRPKRNRASGREHRP